MAPDTIDSDTLQQYVRCYIMLMIGVYLLTDKSNNTVHLRWLPLLDDFERCRSMSWDSAVLAWTYNSLCSATHRSTIDIAGCTPLLVDRHGVADQGLPLAESPTMASGFG
ncbi:hypothetical protein Ahy_B04g069770 [Arachis hypogaea]|uniref:Aminotransferase-like plant mobile domain-containing protein n=1 Tax=Arachis hypogaea TaxID=3818 RepID=A0A444ZDJ5_ARAHY|nr:hypothetical protein Ahy_B04g069770 [Arachis hypogaea]